jgi:hypothetical protein
LLETEQERWGAAHHLSMSSPAAGFTYIDPSFSAENLATHLSGLNLSEDALDAAAKEVIAAHRDGLYTAVEARKVLAALMVSSKIIFFTIDRLAGRKSAIEELLDRCQVRMTAKILDETGKYFDLDRAVDGSPSGWLRKNVTLLCTQYFRDIDRANVRFGALDNVGGGVGVDDGTQRTHPSLVCFDPDPLNDPVLDDMRQQQVDEFEEARQALRGQPYVRLVVQQAIKMLGVARAVRPADFADREFIRVAVDTDPMIAYRALETFGAIVYGTDDNPSVIHRDIDPRLLGLWDDFTFEMVERLLEADAQFARALAMDAVTPLPRPSQKAIAKMRGEMCRKATGVRWRSLAATLVDAWVSTEFSAVSDYAVASVDARKTARQGHVIAISKWESVLNSVVAYPGAPMGTSIDGVRAALEEAAERLLSNPGSLAPGLEGVFNSQASGAAEVVTPGAEVITVRSVNVVALD